MNHSGDQPADDLLGGSVAGSPTIRHARLGKPDCHLCADARVIEQVWDLGIWLA